MRLVIVARGPAGADAVRRALRYAPSCRVIGWVDVRRPCGVPIGDAAPDVVVLDDEDGDFVLQRAGEVRAAAPDAKIVLLAADLEQDRLADAAAVGVDAAIAKSAPPATVGMLIREVAAGTVFHFARIPPAARDRTTDDAAACLTARELEILGLAAGGSSNSRIARSLFVTEQTVKFHLSNVYRKLGLSNRTQAAHFAHVHGLAPEMPADDRLEVAA
jgi:DNA-binding NarL/FixJ family response regulator